MEFRCAIPMCGYSTNSQKRSGLSFHLFPKDPDVHKAWIKALGVKNLHINKKSRICSDHFTEDSFCDTMHGRRLRNSALPNVVLDPTVTASLTVCRICLSYRRDMYNIRQYSEAFEQITSLSASEGESRRLPQCLCWECAARLRAAASLRAKALLADGLLRDLLKPDTFLRMGDIKAINTKQVGLNSSLLRKHYDSNHFDYYINDTFAGPDGTNLLENNGSTEDTRLAEVLTEKQTNGGDSRDKVTSLNKLNDNISLYAEHNYSCKINTCYTMENNNNKASTTEEFDEIIEMPETSEGDEIILMPETSEGDEIILMPETSEGDEIILMPETREGDEIILMPETSEVDETSELDETCETNAKKLTNNWNFEVGKRSKTITIVPITVKRTRKKQGLQSKDIRRRFTDKEKTRVISAGEVIPQTKINSRTAKSIDPEYINTIVLTYEQQILEVEKRQESSAYINAPFKCDVCYTGMKDEEVFKRHMVTHSDKSGPYECIICKRRKRTKHYLRHHLTALHSKEYRCRICDFVTRVRGIALKHVDIHKGISRYKCDLCDVVFERSSSYLGHRRLYHLTDNVCELCGYSFLSQNGVKSHKSKHHLQDEVKELTGPYCETCDLKFLSEEAYDIHLRCSAKHLQGEDDPIRIRNEVGSAVRRILRKQTTRTKKKHDPDKKEKDEPPKKITINEPYICELCGKELFNYISYSQHFTYTHPGQRRALFPQEEMSWMCDLCGKMYHTKYALDSHQWVHTEEKRFQCDYCGKKVCYKESLRKHIVSQHLEKSSETKCMLCDKVLMGPTNLKKHLITHLDQKPYACELCPKRFGSMGSLNNHVRYVHYNIPVPPRKRQKLNEEVQEE